MRWIQSAVVVPLLPVHHRSTFRIPVAAFEAWMVLPSQISHTGSTSTSSTADLALGSSACNFGVWPVNSHKGLQTKIIQNVRVHSQESPLSIFQLVALPHIPTLTLASTVAFTSMKMHSTRAAGSSYGRGEIPRVDRVRHHGCTAVGLSAFSTFAYFGPLL